MARTRLVSTPIRWPITLVLDANILVRAALGPRARGIVERHAADAGFFVPACCVDEAREHLPDIERKRGWDAEPVMAALVAVLEMLQVVDAGLYATRAG